MSKFECPNKMGIVFYLHDLINMKRCIMQIMISFVTLKEKVSSWLDNIDREYKEQKFKKREKEIN